VTLQCFGKTSRIFLSLQQLYPLLFSFANEPNCSVGHFPSPMPDYGKFFQLPLLMVASHQFAELVDSLEEWNRELNDNDSWTYIWGSRIFTSKQAYVNMKGHYSAPLTFQWLWKSRCQGKNKVFFWLLLNDRLNTRNLLRHNRFHLPSTNCVMFNHGVEETMHHLFCNVNLHKCAGLPCIRYGI
jgi:hypothetical protein